MIVIWALIAALCSVLLVVTLPGYALMSWFFTMAMLWPWFMFLLPVGLSSFFVFQRMPLGGGLWSQTMLWHLASGLAALALWFLMGQFWAWGLDGFESGDFSALVTSVQSPALILGVVLYGFWQLLHMTVSILVSPQQAQSDALTQRLLVNEIELQAIKATVHPHFLFNSLNMLANLSVTSPESIRSLCVALSQFLRYSISYGQQTRVTLADELEHVHHYLNIEKARFGQHLIVRESIDEKALLTEVFPLLLFPLYENSIKHGVNSSTEPGYIDTRITSNGYFVRIEVENSMDELGKKPEGTQQGLLHVQKRLQARFGQTATLRTHHTQGLFRVTLLVPMESDPSRGDA